MMRTISDAHSRSLENEDVKRKAVAKNKQKHDENEEEEENKNAAKRKAKDKKATGLKNQPKGPAKVKTEPPKKHASKNGRFSVGDFTRRSRRIRKEVHYKQ
jgi:hypothetical protein